MTLLIISSPRNAIERRKSDSKNIAFWKKSHFLKMHCTTYYAMAASSKQSGKTVLHGTVVVGEKALPDPRVRFTYVLQRLSGGPQNRIGDTRTCSLHYSAARTNTLTDHSLQNLLISIVVVSTWWHANVVEKCPVKHCAAIGGIAVVRRGSCLVPIFLTCDIVPSEIDTVVPPPGGVRRIARFLRFSTTKSQKIAIFRPRDILMGP